ncbi:MAG: pyruvate dehydrogenase [Firmicutes bacterium]|nr:pyruvate dehydrogenase [Bacillota bacterium]
MTRLERQYRSMLTIRRFEERVLDLFGRDLVSGTTHTYIGQEAIAVALMQHVKEGDIIFSNHRCHGHYLAYGGPPELLLGEILTKECGMCGGNGGSQHLHYRNFYTNGVQGGIVPNAVGMAWAEKINGTDNIAIVFLGDGTLGQGVVYESFNLASLLEVPILFVVENNQYAMSTRTVDALAGSFAARAEAFAIEHDQISSNDVEVLTQGFDRAIGYVRKTKRPFCQIVHTYRLAAHSKGDDTRPAEEVSSYKKSDPISIARSKLGDDKCRQIEEEVEKKIGSVVDRVLKAAPSKAKEAVVKNVRAKNFDVYNRASMRCVEAISKALDTVLAENEDALVIGEDVRDPCGGAFKVTAGLSTKYPDRVLNMPISEAAIIGSGIGLAMNGKLPIIEIMFGDFITLGFDQLVNHAAKYNWLYDKQVPLVIRTPMGAGRGYGPTHSQSLEKFLIGVPMIEVLALSPIHNVQALYSYALSYLERPLIIIENKKMYGQRLLQCSKGKINDFFVCHSWNEAFPTIKLSLDPESPPDVTLVTYGGMVMDVMDAAVGLLLEDEVQVDIVVMSQISPIPMSDLENLVDGFGWVGVVEEGTRHCGIGAEVVAGLAEQRLGKGFFRVAAQDQPIPNGIELERYVLPSAEKIVDKIRGVLA